MSKIDADQPVYNARTVDEIVEREAAGFRAIAQILGTVGFGALALAAVGIYGVITWSMSQRRQEIGIRRAVGASGRDIVWLTVRQGLTPVAIGLVIGTGLSVGFAFMLRGLMFEIAPAAPANYLVPAAGLLVVATAASLVPAARATRLDPLAVLRHDRGGAPNTATFRHWPSVAAPTLVRFCNVSRRARKNRAPAAVSRYGWRRPSAATGSISLRDRAARSLRKASPDRSAVPPSSRCPRSSRSRASDRRRR